MKLYELTEEEFRNFLNNHPLKTFLQTPEMASLKEKKGWEKYYVGLKKNDEIVGATMMVAHNSFMHKKRFYAPRGILIDYENKKLVKTFILELKEFIKKEMDMFFKWILTMNLGNMILMEIL